MSTQSHYFIAVPIKERLKEQLSTWQKNLQPLLTYKQWPHKDDLHITLKFLGAIGADQIQNVQHAFKRLESLDAFSVRAKGIGTFGQPDKPRVLWAGVEKNKALMALYHRVEDIASACSFTKDNRPYRPHITLAKKWQGPPSGDIVQKIKRQYRNEHSLLNIQEVVLYQIHPQQTPKYEAKTVYQLRSR